MSKDFREEFLEQNPDKEIHIHTIVSSGYGTHKYKCTYSDNWEAQELINYVDNGTGNYGGRIENEKKNNNGTTTATVCVYYD